MIKKIILTPLAISNYEDIIEYLINKWGTLVAEDFIRRFVNVRMMLAESTEIFPFENKRKVIKRCVLTKHNILYFKETDSEIIILTIFDTRQDPKKLSSII